MSSHLQRAPLGPALQAAPPLLALASVATLAIGAAFRHAWVAVPGDDLLQALQSWPFLAATALGISSRFTHARSLRGALALAMALSFLLVAAAGLVQLVAAPGQSIAAPACTALLSFGLGLFALHIALLSFARAASSTRHPRSN